MSPFLSHWTMDDGLLMARAKTLKSIKSIKKERKKNPNTQIIQQHNNKRILCNHLGRGESEMEC